MIEFRKATKDDLGELVRLRIDFIKELNGSNESGIYKELTQLMQEYLTINLPQDNFIAWIAVCNNEIVGTSGLCFYKLPPSFKNLTGNVAYIMNMYTIPAFRGRGIAKTLFAKIIEEARNRGYRKLSLHATEMGRPIYKKFGFGSVDTEMALYL